MVRFMNETTIHRRVEAIKKKRRKSGLTISRLAEIARLPRSTIQGMESPEWNPTVNTLAAIERALRD